MVSTTSIVFMFVSLALSLLLPIALAVVLTKRLKCSPWAFMVGAAMMALFQFVLRIPLLRATASTGWAKALSTNIWAYGLFLGLTAGLFEAAGRFLGFTVFLRDQLEWKNGIAYGIGHGGIEAIVLVGLPYINNVAYSMMINAGTFGSQVAAKLPPGVGDYLQSALTATPSPIFLLGGIERVLAMTVQVALSLLVLCGVASRKIRYVVYAVLLHTLLDAPLVWVRQYTSNPWILEIWVLLAAIVSAVFISRSRQWLQARTAEK